MTIQGSLRWATKKLKQKNIISANLDAEVLLSFVLKKPKEFLFTYPERKLTQKQWKRFQKLVNRRNKYEPIAYLIKNKQFYGLNFYVDKRVLVPRPETETLVDLILKEISRTISHKPLAIADIGTGSGCIAIALAKNLPKAKIFATDNSKNALVVARLNNRQNQTKVSLFWGNLLNPLKNRKIDYIIANLPYLPASYLKKPPQKVQFQTLKYEPKKALISHKIFTDFFKQIKEFKLKPKAIFLEIDPTSLKKIKSLIKKYLPKYQVEEIKNSREETSFLIIEQ